MYNYFSYILNKNIKDSAEKIFEGIAGGREKALYNWFKDSWAAIEITRDTIISCVEKNSFKEDMINELLTAKKEQYKDFSEIFILDNEAKVMFSTFRENIGKSRKSFPNFSYGLNGKPYMYGPYIDEESLKIKNSSSHFFDEVTLMFSMPYENKRSGKIEILCVRIPNDVMSDIIQEEDTHVYKESGDNYLFMINSNRNIAKGTAISRSRFEDKTFSLGDNLKDGVQTKKWGVVKVNKHTEFELVFNDPSTNILHIGVANTIKNGSNLDCRPGYPDYRHIMVGGKGITIRPPHSDEVWGMMCEGDISEIYKFTSIKSKMVFSYIMLTIFIFIVELGLKKIFNSNIYLKIMEWIIAVGGIYLFTQKLVVKPLIKTVDIIKELAEGEGDLSLRIEKNSNDEIGELARWTNKFINNQKTMIRRMERAATDSKQSTETIAGFINNQAKRIEEISANTEKASCKINEENIENEKEAREILDIIEYIPSQVSQISKVINYSTDNLKNIVSAFKV